MPGVLGVFTAADLRDLGPLPCTVPVASVAPMIVPPRPALAAERARHVGDPVAFVVAETRTAARDAAEAVNVDYRMLPAVVDAPAALLPAAPQLWAQAHGNLSYRFQKGDAGAVAAAMRDAAHVVELELVNNRIVISAMETRGAIGQHDAGGFHLMFSGAGVHALQSQLADSVFRVPRAQMRVSCPDVGGGFGVKNALYPEWVMLLWAARTLGRPVKWIGERTEDFVTTAQGRDNVTRARLALDARGSLPRAGRCHYCQSRRVSVRRAARAVPPMRRPTPWAAAMSFRRSSWTCRACSPTPCRSMPIAAPASPK